MRPRPLPSHLLHAAALLLALGVTAAAQDEAARDLFERGYYQEHALKDLDAAAATYRRVADQAEDDDRELAGRALIRLAACEQQRGRAVEARELLQEVLRDYADVDRVRREADEALAAAGTVQRALRLYDIEYLTRPVTDDPAPEVPLWPAPRGGGGGGAAAGGAFSFDDAGDVAEGRRLDPDQLVELIVQNIAEDSWQNARNDITVRANQLVVVQTPEVHAEIERYLDQLRRLRGRLVAFDVRVVLLEGRFADELTARGAVAPPEPLKALEARLLEGEGARLLEQHRVTAFDRQRVHVASLRERRYLGSYAVRNTGVVPEVQPEPRTGHEGFSLELRPVLTGEPAHLLVEARGAFADWGQREQEVAVGDVEGPHDVGLQVPEADVFELDAGLLVPVGRTVVLGGIRADSFAWEGAWSDPRLVVLVRATLNALEAGAPAESERTPSAARSLKIYNVSLLTERLSEDPDPWDDDQEQVLLDMIRENISPDSWQNDLNRLEIFHDGALLVVQTPQVHAQVASFLRTLRRARGRVLHVEVFRFARDPARLRELLDQAQPEAGGGFTLSAEDLEALLAGQDAPASYAALSLRDGQRGRVGERAVHAYLETYEQSSGGTGLVVETVVVPVLGYVEGATSCRVRPKLLPDGEHVSVELDLLLGRVDVEGAPPATTRFGPLQLPRRAERRFKTHLTFPLDRVLLVGASTSVAGGPGEGVVLLRVRAEDLLGE